MFGLCHFLKKKSYFVNKKTSILVTSMVVKDIVWTFTYTYCSMTSVSSCQCLGHGETAIDEYSSSQFSLTKLTLAPALTTLNMNFQCWMKGIWTEGNDLHMKYCSVIAGHFLQTFSLLMFTIPTNWQLSDAAPETDLVLRCLFSAHHLRADFHQSTNKLLCTASFEWTPTCLRLSSHTCTVCSAWRIKIPHRQAKQISISGKHQTIGERLCCL